MDYNTIWFCLVGILLTGYALLDGFDLGVGFLQIFARSDKDRRMAVHSIGPVWDGNEVWLLGAGTSLFAAFPPVYATIFSGFYLALVLVLFALILRAVSIEFAAKLESPAWRLAWDRTLAATSFAAALLLGVALGNIARGIPLEENGEYAGTLFGLLNPYALLTGLTTASLFTMHGALYLNLKTEGELQQRARSWARKAFVVFGILFAAVTVYTWTSTGRMTEPFLSSPILFAVPLVLLLAAADIPHELRAGRDSRAFLASCVVIVSLMVLFAIGTYPNMVPSNPHPERSLTIHDSSTAKTLGIMFVIAVFAIPVVLAYNVFVYRVFRGKVPQDPEGY